MAALQRPWGVVARFHRVLRRSTERARRICSLTRLRVRWVAMASLLGSTRCYLMYHTMCGVGGVQLGRVQAYKFPPPGVYKSEPGGAFNSAPPGVLERLGSGVRGGPVGGVQVRHLEAYELGPSEAYKLNAHRGGAERTSSVQVAYNSAPGRAYNFRTSSVQS